MPICDILYFLIGNRVFIVIIFGLGCSLFIECCLKYLICCLFFYFLLFFNNVLNLYIFYFDFYLNPWQYADIFIFSLLFTRIHIHYLYLAYCYCYYFPNSCSFTFFFFSLILILNNNKHAYLLQLPHSSSYCTRPIIRCSMWISKTTILIWFVACLPCATEWF